MAKQKGVRGRPRLSGGSNSLTEIKPLAIEASWKLLCEQLAAEREDLRDRIESQYAEFHSEPTGDDERALALDLLRMLNESHAGARSGSNLWAWFRGEVAPVLERKADMLKSWSWKRRREIDSVTTKVVQALDRTNFLGLVNRPAFDNEMAAVALIKGLGIRPQPSRERPVRVDEVLSETCKIVRKSRRLHGRPYLNAKFIAEMLAAMTPAERNDFEELSARITVRHL